ncbi:MAG: 50S ribosomal protein L10 [Bacteroidia bacterium]|nr:50S ribosomal protein L10 [Bacteroidia bacterium]MCX7652263.1 50S ribosomal protein L10 [Bacteroidia bacterium]MDW8416525.1 50S ribosomal protein L10 [Bacteroidia bacterium]
MNKEQKTQLIEELTQTIKNNRAFYILNPGPMNAEETVTFRRRLYEKGLRLRVVKNSLLLKALENAGIPETHNFEPALKEMSGIVLCTNDPKAPAQVLESFRKETKKDYPTLKAAYVEDTLFVGEQHLEALTRLKSKSDLLAELVGRLQAPIQQVVSALQGAGHTLAGILKTLSERNN